MLWPCGYCQMLLIIIWLQMRWNRRCSNSFMNIIFISSSPISNQIGFHAVVKIFIFSRKTPVTISKSSHYRLNKSQVYLRTLKLRLIWFPVFVTWFRAECLSLIIAAYTALDGMTQCNLTADSFVCVSIITRPYQGFIIG